MTHNERELYDRVVRLNAMIDAKDFLIDKTGVKIVELRAEILKMDPRQPIIDIGPKKTSADYVTKELAWYLSQDRNIKGWVDDVKIWQTTADRDGIVNSNYGWCVFSKENGSQFDHVIEELIEHPDSRRASMIYTRPSMWADWNENGRNDFMCTAYVQIFIRNTRLEYHIHQRSCDCNYGFFNDFAWHCYVYKHLHKAYFDRTNIMLGSRYDSMKYIIDSLHVYERHFDLVKKIVEHKQSIR